MRLLLDTHARLWWLADEPRLGEVALAALTGAGNEVYVSAASAWALAIKATGKSVDASMVSCPHDRDMAGR